jgi:hypothetical protein
MGIKPARLLWAVTIAAGCAAASAPAASAAGGETQQAMSENWAGYVAGGSSAGSSK